jgi:hypothetical protein
MKAFRAWWRSFETRRAGAYSGPVTRAGMASLGSTATTRAPPGHARNGSRFHTEHTLAAVLDVQREYEQIVNLVRRYDAGAG